MEKNSKPVFNPYLVLALLVYGTSTLLLLAFNLAAANPLFSYGSTDWLIFAALAAVPTICGHTLLNWSLKLLSVFIF